MAQTDKLFLNILFTYLMDISLISTLSTIQHHDQNNIQPQLWKLTQDGIH